MSKVDNFIDKFFDRIKKKQADKIIKNFKKTNPELGKKLDQIHQASQELEDFLNKSSNK